MGQGTQRKKDLLGQEDLSKEKTEMDNRPNGTSDLKDKRPK